MNSRPIRVLLIEDNPSDADIVKRLLRKAKSDFDLHWEQSLSAGLVQLEQGDFDVVLSDLSLPDSDGRETIARIRQRAESKPIVVLTGIDDSQLAIELLEVGAQDYFVKGSVSDDGLDRAIRHSLQRHENLLKIRELLDEVEMQNELLEKKNKKLSKLYAQAHEFVDNVSHEFRTPLTVIKEYVSLVREGLVGEVNGEQERLLNVAEDRADDLNIMVDDMLDVSKLEAGMLGAWRRVCPVEDIFEHVRASLERKAEVRKVRLDWEIDSDIPHVYCDAEKAGRVVTNLAINAIKFCGEAGIVRIGARTDLVAREVTISITDNGPGIDEEALATIFRRFEQLTNNVRGSTKGFGLGLNIAKELVELNFGQLSVQSQLKKGSTFSFTIPIADPLEVTRRYLQRIERVERVEDGTSSVSIIEATVGELVDASLADDIDAFLNCCLRKNDLLFRVGDRRWVIALPEPNCEVEKYFDRVEGEWESANRNRPFGPLPDVDMSSQGSWRVAIHQDRVLDCVRALVQTEELSHA